MHSSAVSSSTIPTAPHNTLHRPHALPPQTPQAATRIGAVYVSLPDTISIKALADRLHDCRPSLVLTTAALAPGGSSHHGGGATSLKTIVQVRWARHHTQRIARLHAHTHDT